MCFSFPVGRAQSHPVAAMDEMEGLRPGHDPKDSRLPHTDEGILYVLDKLVLPVLDEFEPELVINSAGQDNHYTDPLANMHFSARGYAVLNERLSPNIAVLEGGYSVETALPYVNMGIIMAMAGIDYSNLYEPDYQERKFTEEGKKLVLLEKIVNQLTQIFQARESMQAAFRQKAGPYHQTERHIYYDTDGIREFQRETLRICPDCPGYTTITRASHAHGAVSHVFCIGIPFQACSRCQEEGMEKYEEDAGKRAIFNIFSSRWTADVCRQYHVQKRKEIEY